MKTMCPPGYRNSGFAQLLFIVGNRFQEQNCKI